MLLGTMFDPGTESIIYILRDFDIDYCAGRLNLIRWQKCPMLDVYDPILLKQSMAEVLAPFPTQFSLFPYPPYDLPIFTLLAHLNLETALCAYNVFNLVALFLAAYILIHKSTRQIWLSGALAFAVAFSPAMLTSSLRMGQSAGIVALAFAIFWCTLRSRKYFLSGLAIGLCMFKPQYAPMLAVAGIIVGRWAFLRGLFICCAVLLSIAVAAAGLQSLAAYSFTIQLCDLYPIERMSVRDMQNFLAAALDLSGNWTVAHHTALLALTLSLLLTAKLWLRYLKRLQCDDLTFEVCASVTTCLALMFSPHGYIYDYALLTVPLIWLFQWAEGFASRQRRDLYETLLLAVPALSWIFLYFKSVENRCPFFFYMTGIIVGATLILSRRKVDPVAR